MNTLIKKGRLTERTTGKFVYVTNRDVVVDLLRKYMFRGNSRGKGRFNEYAESVAEHFGTIEQNLLDYVRKRCLAPRMDIAKGIYSFLNLSKKTTFHLFTTNYDPILESVCVDMGFDYADGFQPDKKIGAFRWDEKCLGSEKINIYKLHGSVTWFRKDNQVLKFPADISNSPGVKTLMLYPTELKEILNPPYSQIHRALEKELFESDMCVAVGHTFRDDYIRNLFAERLAERGFAMYLICGTFTRSIKQKAFGSTNMIRPIVANFEDVYMTDLLRKHVRQ